jgi:hypothetical protein
VGLLWDVWHQWPPVKVAGVEERFGEQVRVYEPAIVYRGQVEAFDSDEAISEAVRLRLSPWPLVRMA